MRFVSWFCLFDRFVSLYILFMASPFPFDKVLKQTILLK